MIKTQIWKPVPDEPGMLKYQGQGKMKMIESQIKYALDKILVDDEGTTAFGILYWMKGHHPHLKEWYKRTIPAATVRRGNEGYLIEILALNREAPDAQLMFTLKFEGTSHQDTWNIARQLDAFFDLD